MDVSRAPRYTWTRGTPAENGLTLRPCAGRNWRNDESLRTATMSSKPKEQRQRESFDEESAITQQVDIRQGGAQKKNEQNTPQLQAEKEELLALREQKRKKRDREGRESGGRDGDGRDGDGREGGGPSHITGVAPS